MLLNSKKGKVTILLPANAPATAEVLLDSLGGGIKTIKWQLFKEDWLRINNQANTKKLTPLSQLNKNSTEPAMKNQPLIKPPTKRELLTLRLMILLGVGSMVFFMTNLLAESVRGNRAQYAMLIKAFLF